MADNEKNPPLSDNDKVKLAIAKQGIGAAMGGVAGAVTKHQSHTGPLAGQIGSAVGVTLATGGTVGAALGSGVGVVTAKVVAVKVAVVSAAIVGAPIVAAGAALAFLGFGIKKLIDDA